jgi:hypothetical protein
MIPDCLHFSGIHRRKMEECERSVPTTWASNHRRHDNRKIQQPHQTEKLIEEYLLFLQFDTS